MDFSKIFIKDANPTKMGGQAVMEGIMMKGADRSAIAVRRADGSINIKEEPLPPKKDSQLFGSPPFTGSFQIYQSLLELFLEETEFKNHGC